MTDNQIHKPDEDGLWPPDEATDPYKRGAHEERARIRAQVVAWRDLEQNAINVRGKVGLDTTPEAYACQAFNRVLALIDGGKWECPSCGRVFDEQQTVCPSDDCPSRDNLLDGEGGA